MTFEMIGWGTLGILLTSAFVFGLWSKMSRKAILSIMAIILLIFGPGITNINRIYQSILDFTQGRSNIPDFFLSLAKTISFSWKTWDEEVYKYSNSEPNSANSLYLFFCISAELNFIYFFYAFFEGILRKPLSRTYKQEFVYSFVFLLLALSVGAIATWGYPGLRNLPNILTHHISIPKNITIGGNFGNQTNITS